jgi:uncharacterized protein DUF2510
MVETNDPAGWYSDPTGNHELRYWDGYTWLDNVSDRGVTSDDPLGGKPLPSPSQAASGAPAAGQPQPSSTTKSKAPIIIGAVVAVVVIAAAVFFFTRGDGNDTVALKDKPVTFSDEGKDATRPTVHAVKVEGNRAVTMTVKGDDANLVPAIIVQTNQQVVDSVNSQISDASDQLGGDKLKDVCSNLREEDIGAKGNVTYFFDFAGDAGSELRTFVPVPAAGNFEFVPVLLDDNGDCKGGKVTTTIAAVPLDLGNVSNLSDLDSVLSDDSNLSEFISS